ncbi:hypothetical protein ANCDUO_18778, partial [Ancylostoma duodenale]
GFWEDAVIDNIDEQYDRLVQHLRDSAKSAEDPARRQRAAARAAGNYRLMSELAKRCREARKEDLKERRAAVLSEAAEGGKPNDSNFNLCMMPTKEQVEATPGTPLTKGMPE